MAQQEVTLKMDTAIVYTGHHGLGFILNTREGTHAQIELLNGGVVEVKLTECQVRATYADLLAEQARVCFNVYLSDKRRPARHHFNFGSRTFYVTVQKTGVLTVTNYKGEVVWSDAREAE